MRYRVRGIRTPKPEHLLSVSFTGTARSVAWMSQALASVVVVTSMRRHIDVDGSVRVDVTCYRPRLTGKNGSR